MNYRTLPPTFQLITDEKSGISIPFQNKVIYPSFEAQNNPMISLHGVWKKVRVNDPKLSLHIRDERTIDKLRTEVKGITLSNFNDHDLKDHRLPGVENTIGHKIEAHNKGMETYEAGVWYRKIITVDKQEDRVYLFKALAMSMIADLFINDVYIGTHEGSFNPFSFDITQALHAGDNVFALRVHNIPWGSRIDTIPAQDGTDYFNYTGVIHDFWIEEIPQVSVRRVDLIPKTLKECEVTLIAVNSTNKTQVLTLGFEVYGTNITNENLGSDCAASLCADLVSTLENKTLKLEPNTYEVIRFTFDTTHLKPWELLDPSIYVLKTSTPYETLTHDFGVRILSTTKQSILLNGQVVFLNGMARHEEHLNKGRSLSHQDIVEACLQLKQMNLNFTRTAHYPNHPLTYRILDRLGIASMMEVPLWQHEDEHFKAQLNRRIDQQMWREMCFVQRNRPSVFLWSTQNECNGDNYRVMYNRRLVNDLRDHFDDGRLTTQSAAADRPGYSDPSMAALDVVSYTLYFGIFHGQPHNTEHPDLANAYLGTRNYLLSAHKYHKKPILVSEYGIWSSAGSSVQHAIIINNLRAFSELRTMNFDGSQNKRGFVTGINYWTINDWFVNHNTWIQSMGFKTLDRSDKSIVSAIKPHFKALISPKYSPCDPLRLWRGHQYLTSPNSLIYSNANGFDASKWAYMGIKGDDPMSDDGFSLVITNKNGEEKTLIVEKIEELMIFHLWLLDDGFLKNMVALTILVNDSGRRIHLRQIDCFNSF